MTSLRSPNYHLFSHLYFLFLFWPPPTLDWYHLVPIWRPELYPQIWQLDLHCQIPQFGHHQWHGHYWKFRWKFWVGTPEFSSQKDFGTLSRRLLHWSHLWTQHQTKDHVLLFQLDFTLCAHCFHGSTGLLFPTWIWRKSHFGNHHSHVFNLFHERCDRNGTPLIQNPFDRYVKKKSTLFMAFVSWCASASSIL